MKLRDGSKTKDRRLDRIKSFDPKSRRYPIRALVPKKPRSYSWSCNQWLDQGSEGACVGFGITHELIARPVPVQGLTNSYAREKVYWEAQKIDEWPGGAYPGAKPFSEGSSVLAGMKVVQKLGWIDEYRWSFGLQELILGVGYNGPSVLGINWYSDMFDTDSDGFIHASGSIEGGHCILCRSVSIPKKRFTLHNSWGKSWGVNGEAYISFDDMAKLLKEDGEAAFFIGRHREPKAR